MATKTETTIHDEMKRRGFDLAKCSHLQNDPDQIEYFLQADGWGQWPLTSPCGKECLKVMKTSEALLKLARDINGEHGERDVWNVTVELMLIICVG